VLAFEFQSPLLNQVNHFLLHLIWVINNTYFTWQLFAVKHSDKHLHKFFVSYLTVERSRAFIHKHIYQTKAQKHHLRLVRSESLADADSNNSTTGKS